MRLTKGVPWKVRTFVARSRVSLQRANLSEGWGGISLYYPLHSASAAAAGQEEVRGETSAFEIELPPAQPTLLLLLDIATATLRIT